MYDLSRLYINFEECPPGKKLCEHFSELAAFEEFAKIDDVLIKIAILGGDIDSPFVRIKDRETMVKAIFEYLNITDKKLMSAIVSYQDHRVTMAWLRYLQILHETDFTDWQLAKKDYDYFLQKSNEPQGENESDDKYLAKRNKIRETIKKLGEEVRAIEAKLFPDSKAAREAAIAEAKNKIKLFAEAYAQEYSHI